jgi:hypothetical protein
VTVEPSVSPEQLHADSVELAAELPCRDVTSHAATWASARGHRAVRRGAVGLGYGEAGTLRSCTYSSLSNQPPEQALCI